jgi:hypothetical protein
MAKWWVVTLTDQQARILGGQWQTKPDLCERVGVPYWSRKPLELDLMTVLPDDLAAIIEALEHSHGMFKNKRGAWWKKTTSDLEAVLAPMRRFHEMSAIDKLAEFA